MFNGLLKVPMQFFILLVGIMVFEFFQFNEPPAFFNQPGMEQARSTDYAPEIKRIEKNTAMFTTKKNASWGCF